MRAPDIAVMTLLLVAATPSARAAPCAGFDDVDSASSFCGDVSWVKNRGITLGCAANLYCPNNAVTRLQMAAFLRRLAENAVFQRDGNAWGGTAVLGTLDNQSLDIRVNNARALRLEPHATSPNHVAGSLGNVVTPGVAGAAIAGGGNAAASGCPGIYACWNRVTDDYGVVAGGYANQAGDGAGATNTSSHATVAGGYSNQAQGRGATVLGGELNVAGPGANATVAGGLKNWASGELSAVQGGERNTASGALSVVQGGEHNTASGSYSSVAGATVLLQISRSSLAVRRTSPVAGLRWRRVSKPSRRTSRASSGTDGAKVRVRARAIDAFTSLPTTDLVSITASSSPTDPRAPGS